MSGKKSNSQIGFAESFLLSGTAAAMSKTSAAPIERVKLLIQNQNELIKQGKLDSGFSGVRDCVTRTLRHEGVLSFWKGILPPIMVETPKRAWKFFTFEQFKTAFRYQLFTMTNTHQTIP